MPRTAHCVADQQSVRKRRAVVRANGVDREKFIERLTEQGVGTSVHFIPCHLHPFYAKHLGHNRGDFPAAEQAFERAISLPLYPAMTDDDAEYVVSAVAHALRAGK